MEDLQQRFRSLTFELHKPGILRVTMDAPHLNAVNRQMHRDLSELWPVVGTDPDIRVVVIRGAGENFSAGGDFAMIREMIDDHLVRSQVMREACDLVYNLINCPKPLISAIQGPAVGAGLVVGMLADISIAGRTARIIDGHTRLGIAAGDHAALVWPLLCGMAKSKYYLLTCEPLSGEEAERIGLVSLVVDDEILQDEALRIAERLARGAPSALSWTKYVLNNWFRCFGPLFDASLAVEFAGMTGPELKEGLQSLLEKRDPDYLSITQRAE